MRLKNWLESPTAEAGKKDELKPAGRALRSKASSRKSELKLGAHNLLNL